MIVRQVAVAMEASRLYRDLKFLTVTDPLTGIYNFRYFTQTLDREINRAKRYERPLCILMIDVDNFKTYNDTYGHIEGDILLKELSKMFKGNVRNTDVACRYAGDEFVLWMQCNESVARQRAKEIIDHVANTSFNWQRHAIKATISVGLSFLSPDNEKSAEALLHEADQAMYQAKRAGKNRYA